MQYRKMKSTGELLSVLGFGCMRLPEKRGKIDEEYAKRQIRMAIDRGVNYIDTAAIYHMGNSEPFLGRALLDGYRQKVNIATKLPPFYVECYDDMSKTLNKQLQKLNTDCIDYYLAHGLTYNSWIKLRDLGFYKFVENATATGKIRHIGFSCHAGKEEFVKILEEFPWKFCQLQINYLDEENQAGTEGMRYAASKGIGIIVMEPLRGGILGQIPPKQIQKVWDLADVKRSPAEWALRWVWNFPEITVVLSGMNDEAQIDENISISIDALPNTLKTKELYIISRARDTFRMIMKVGCTGCRYCMPCPKGVNIPECFLVYNNKYLMNNNMNGTIINYILTTGGVLSKGNEGFASKCISCGMCINACPQHIDIPKHLKMVKKEFEGHLFYFYKMLLNLYLCFDRWKNTNRSKKNKCAIDHFQQIE